MPLKLAGVMTSPSYQTSLVVLKELEVPFTPVLVDFATGDPSRPEHLAHQPYAQVPYLLDEEDGEVFSLYETRAIARYVAVKYAKEGQRLVWDWKEDGAKKAALFEQAASVEVNNFSTPAFGIGLESFWSHNGGNEALKEAHLAALNKNLDVLDKVLAKQKYTAGDELSLVDLFYLPMGHILKEEGYNVLEVESRPNVARWWKDVSSRPSWSAVKALM